MLLLSVETFYLSIKIIVTLSIIVSLVYSIKYESLFNNLIIGVIFTSTTLLYYSHNKTLYITGNILLTLAIIVLIVLVLSKQKYSKKTKWLVGFTGIILLHSFGHFPGRGPMYLLSILPVIGWIYWAIKQDWKLKREISFSLFFFTMLATNFCKLAYSWIP